MSLLTDIVFVRALKSNAELMKQLPAGSVYNTSIALPDVDLDNAPVPYVIVTFDGLQNESLTKDSLYEGSTDSVQVGIEVCAKTRAQLGILTSMVRRTIRTFFEEVTVDDKDYWLVPIDYTLSATGIQYDHIKPCYWQVLNYQCETNADRDDDGQEG